MGHRFKVVGTLESSFSINANNFTMLYFCWHSLADLSSSLHGTGKPMARGVLTMASLGVKEPNSGLSLCSHVTVPTSLYCLTLDASSWKNEVIVTFTSPRYCESGISEAIPGSTPQRRGHVYRYKKKILHTGDIDVYALTRRCLLKRLLSWKSA